MQDNNKVIVQINLGNFGSTGTIMRGIADCAKQEGYNVYCSYPENPNNRNKEDNDYIICSDLTRRAIGRLSRYTGLNGIFGIIPTVKFIRWLKKINPQIIHLHNIHGCGLSILLLFRYIKRKEIKVIWTLHDCWSFTGRCPHFQVTKCDKWKHGCHHCVYPKKSYPESVIDNSRLMWKIKKNTFSSINDLTIVTPSKWLAGLVSESFLSKYKVHVINNGIDLSVFKPTPSNILDKYVDGGG